MMIPSRCHLFALAGALTGCFGDGASEPQPIQPTLIAVAPIDFLGDVACAPEAGALQSYIATFYDVGSDAPSEPGSGIALFSAPPVDCRRSVGSSNVTFDHYYAVEIQAFDRPACGSSTAADCIAALTPGIPIASDLDGNVIAPRWSTSCGRANGGVTPASFRTVYARDCVPLVLDTASAAAAIRLELDSVLGAVACGTEAGRVERFTVIPADPALATRPASCGDVLEFEGLVARRDYAFRVEAFESGIAAPTWASTCRAGAVAGARVTAACTPLSSRGAIVLDLAVLLDSTCSDAALPACSCGGEFDSVTVTLQDGTEPAPERLTGEACRQSLRIPVEAGSHTIDVVLQAPGDAAAPRWSWSCQADVAPESEGHAVCSPSD